MHKERFNITGMTCSACSNRVTKAVSALNGIDDVNVNLLKNSMTVSFDENAVSASDITTAVSKAGYGASPQRKSGKGSNADKGPDPAAIELQEMKQRLLVSVAAGLQRQKGFDSLHAQNGGLQNQQLRL